MRFGTTTEIKMDEHLFVDPIDGMACHVHTKDISMFAIHGNYFVGGPVHLRMKSSIT